MKTPYKVVKTVSLLQLGICVVYMIYFFMDNSIWSNPSKSQIALLYEILLTGSMAVVSGIGLYFKKKWGWSWAIFFYSYISLSLLRDVIYVGKAINDELLINIGYSYMFKFIEILCFVGIFILLNTKHIASVFQQKNTIQKSVYLFVLSLILLVIDSMIMLNIFR
ncbi:hypothetical protein ACFFNY_22260 [Paenibacillus hodogayensis]|uniref:Uncharacterized protein n=1 Tax=Paenibacillus hodogayensis TaxID=279208 RepID=A0ABV5W1B2_9BACL